MLSKNSLPDLALVVELFSPWLGVEAWSANATTGLPGTLYMSFTPGPDTVGEIEPLSLWSGQGVALVRKVQPAAEIVREMNEEANGILRRLGQHCSSQ